MLMVLYQISKIEQDHLRINVAPDESFKVYRSLAVQDSSIGDIVTH